MFSYIYQSYEWLLSNFIYSKNEDFNANIINSINQNVLVNENVEYKNIQQKHDKIKEEILYIIKKKEELFLELKEALKKRRESIIIC